MSTPLSWQRLGYALQPTDMRVIIYPSLCKHWIWVPLTYWKIIVIEALTAHKMGIFLTGISAGDPKQKTSSSFHVMHSEFKTIPQPLVNDPHSRLHKGGKSYGERGWKRGFFFFFVEKHWRAVYPPFLLLQYHPDSGRRPSREGLLETGCWWEWTVGLIPLAGGSLRHRNPRARNCQGTRADCPGKIQETQGQGPELLWLESLQSEGWLEQLW